MKDELISKQELESRLAEFQSDLKNKVSDRSSQVKALVGGVSSLGMLSSFLLGRRSGKKRSGLFGSRSTD